MYTYVKICIHRCIQSNLIKKKKKSKNIKLHENPLTVLNQ